MPRGVERLQHPGSEGVKRCNERVYGVSDDSVRQGLEGAWKGYLLPAAEKCAQPPGVERPCPGALPWALGLGPAGHLAP